MITSYAQSVAELAKEGAKIAKDKGVLSACGKMCSECAFNWNQPHTLCYFLAADLAARKLMEGGEFNCHTSTYQCADKPCAGFLMAKHAYSNNDINVTGS
jgi:hypothetical protein